MSALMCTPVPDEVGSSEAAWFAFATIQLVTLLRIAADLSPDPMAWQAIAACGWLLAFAPWVWRIGRIVLAPRRDGTPG